MSRPAAQPRAPFSPAYARPALIAGPVLRTPALTCATSDPNRFTDEWKARLRHPGVPREALPPALKRTFDAGELAKERFRRASSLGPGLPPLDAGKGSKTKVSPE
jgi:hypothetical protein